MAKLNSPILFVYKVVVIRVSNFIQGIMMYKKRFLLFSSVIFSLLLFSSQIFAQSKGNIKGIVKDKATGEPLIGTNVFLDGTGFGAASDIDGNFRLTNIPSGEYKLRASYIGYQAQVLIIRIEPNKTLELDIELGFSGALETEDVVVTAQAKGQMSAINEQLSSNSITNVISAARLQELPDANAAESVGRLPGVSVLRNGGEGSKVVIRGLSPKYNKIMLEGISMASTGDDRSTDISMISPYSLDGIEVLKAVTADRDGDFIGGTVNFKLREADPGFKYDFIAQGGYNGLKQTSSDYMVTGSVSNRFFDDNLGIYLQGNIEQRNRSSNQLGASYELRNPELGIKNTVYTKNLKLTDAIRERSRLGVTFVLDYKIPDGVFHFKNFFSKSETSVNRYNQIFNVLGRNHNYETRDEQYNLSTITNIFDYEQRFSSWTISAKISHSFAKNDIPKNLSFLFEQQGALETNVLNQVVPPFELDNFTKINNSTSFFRTLDESYSNTEEQQIAAKLDLQYDFTFSDQINGKVKFGGKYRSKDRFFDKEVFGGNFLLNSGQAVKNAILNAFPYMKDITSIGSSRLPYILFWDKDFDHGNFLEGEYSLGPVVRVELMQEVLAAIKRVENPSLETYIRHDFNSNKQDYSGNEYLNAGYVMAELNIGSKIKLLPGLRYEHNRTVYTGARGNAALAFPNQKYVFKDTTITRTNGFLLPMMHIKYSPFEWLSVRFAYTHTLSRPSYNLIMPRIDIENSVVTWNNAKLKPEFSENFDLYFSFQENKVGLFTIGAFSKRIENMIFNLGRRVILEPSEFELPEEVKNRDIYTHANNQHDAKLWGIEADWQTNFWYLPGLLKGLVLNINYTHIFSEAKYPRTEVTKELNPITFRYSYSNVDSFYTDKLQEQPDDIINVQLGYDYKGFSTRISMLYQSKIFKNPNFWFELSEFSDKYVRWDFSVKQQLPWYGLQVFCNINNITGAQDRDLIQGARWEASIQHYGMTVDLGLRVRL